MAKKKVLNRIKVVLVEKGRTNNWLAQKIGKEKVTISRYCTNDTQPSLQTLYQIADVLEIDVRELLIPNVQKEAVILSKPKSKN
ncbi:MAG TPA: helix-turn-helix transcriptional regulator [Cytophagaceae bacterium]|jgi:transcriptional regulator with XRE-family HTH domain|nr:helix-turn-helix transcriptional regulator [Cytophagaceae bacterium]